ncbi:hypothetical protein GCM10027600_33150 [Nocardioides ginsengisegetis]
MNAGGDEGAADGSRQSCEANLREAAARWFPSTFVGAVADCAGSIRKEEATSAETPAALSMDLRM